MRDEQDGRRKRRDGIIVVVIPRKNNKKCLPQDCVTENLTAAAAQVFSFCLDHLPVNLISFMMSSYDEEMVVMILEPQVSNCNVFPKNANQKETQFLTCLTSLSLSF